MTKQKKKKKKKDVMIVLATYGCVTNYAKI